MKKIILSLILTLGLICTIFTVTPHAKDNESKYIINQSEIETEYIMGGTVYKQTADTYYDGYLDSTSKYYKLSPQTYQWIDMASSSQDIKTVVWSCGTTDGFKASTTTATAKDWEAKHPGWIVVAGGNGDWFRINDTCEATNIMVQDGEVIRPFTYTNVDWRQVIGWSNGEDLIIGVPTIDNYMSLHIYNDKETYTNNYNDETAKITIAGYNTAPSDTGVYLLTKDATDYYDLTGFNVYVGQYDLCRVEYDTRRPFVKGTIKKITNELGTDSRPVITRDKETVREFYLVTKESSLDDVLNVNNYVKCQFDLNGKWANVTDACGYVNQCLSNYQPLWGEDCDTYGQYDEKTAVKPRMVIGFKEDGSIVLMDIDGRDEKSGRTGVSCFEAGELMRLAGCVDAYNLDGGGSATLIIRNEYGDFDIVNTPSDGSERQIGNAILFVTRDPGISWNIKDTTRSEVIFTKEDNEYSNQITNAVVEINGKKAEFKDGKAVISGLEENTEYIATISYKAPSPQNSSEIVDGSYKVKVKTKAFQIPNSGIRFTDITKTTVTANKSIGDYDIKDVVIDIDGFEYEMGSNTTFKINNLFSETKYNVTIKYTVVDFETGKEYQAEETNSFITLKYDLPSVKEFYIYKETKNQVIIKYNYIDEDEISLKAVITCNGTEYPLEKKIGNLTIPNLNTENELYELQLVISYKDGKLAKSVKSEVIKAGKGVEISNSHTITYELDGGTLPSSAVSTYVEGTGLEKLPTPTKDGYKFDGWYDENDNKVTSISKTDNTDITLYAKWTESKQNNGCSFGTSIKYLVSFTVLLATLALLRKKK